MKWKDVLPTEGDFRVRRVFAWWPQRIGQTKIWLECFWLTEQCVLPGTDNDSPIWAVRRFHLNKPELIR